MSATATTKCLQCGQLFLKGKATEHNNSCIGKPLGGGGGGVSSTVVPNQCRDCGNFFSGHFSIHKPKCSSRIEKAAGTEKSPAPSEGGGGNNSKGPKVPESSSAAAASSGGGGNKGPAKAVAVEDLTLIPRGMALKMRDLTFVNTSGQILDISKICGHMVQAPGFSCTKADCSAKLLKGGYCYITATGILFAVVEPKTADNNRAYWRAPTAEEIARFKMPVAATAAADI